MSEASNSRRARLDVAIVVPTDVRSRAGGIATFIRSFIRHAPGDFAITVIGASDRGEVEGVCNSISVGGRQIEHLAVARIVDPNRRTTIPVAAHFAWGLLRHRKAVRDAVRGAVLQLHRPGSDLPVAFTGAGGRVRILHTFSQQLTTPTGGSRWRLLPRAFGAVERWSLHRADALIAVNEAAAREYQHQYPHLAERIHFVPNWVELKDFQPGLLHDAVSPARQNIGVPVDVPLITVVGRLAREKRPDLALEVFRHVARKRPEAHLLFVGDGPLRMELVRRAGELGLSARVHLVGVVEHAAVAEFLWASDVTLISSAHETGPTTCLESLAAGVPVVATPVGQTTKWITDGRNGYTALPKAEQLARAVLRVLDGDAARFRAEAISSAQPYDAPDLLASVYDFHREADGASRGRA